MLPSIIDNELKLFTVSPDAVVALTVTVSSARLLAPVIAEASSNA